MKSALIQKPIWIITLLFILLFSCEKDFSNSLLPEYPGDRLVLNGLLNPNKTLEIQLLHTLRPLDFIDSLPIVPDATIRLFENDIFIKQLQYIGDGKYVVNPSFLVKEGKSYHIEAEALGFPSIMTTSVLIPQASQEASIAYLDSMYLCSGCSGPLDALKFLGIKNDENYLKLTLTGVKDGEDYSLVDEVYDMSHQIFPCQSQIPLRNQPCTNDNQLISIYNEVFPLSSDVSNRRYFSSIKCEVSHISQEYFEYFKSVNQSSGLEAVFVPQDSVFSNVIGGYGLVAGVNNKVFIIQ